MRLFFIYYPNCQDNLNKISKPLRNYKTPVNFQTPAKSTYTYLLSKISTIQKISHTYISSLRFIAVVLPFNIFKIYSHVVFLKYSGSIVTRLS